MPGAGGPPAAAAAAAAETEAEAAASAGGVSADDPDLLGTLGPSAAFPFPQHCFQFSSLCRESYNSRGKLQEKLAELLFGKETDLERVVNDASDSFRAGLESVGVGSWAEALLGSATERPPPHAELRLRRAAGQPVEVELLPVSEAPDTAPDPVSEPLAAPAPPSYEDAWAIAAHYRIGEDASGYSDLRVTAVAGAHEALVSDSLALADRLLRVFSWLAAPAGDGEVLTKAFNAFLPQTNEFFNRFAEADAALFSKKDLGEGLVEVNFSAPLNFDRGAESYPRTMELVRLFDPLLLHARDPKTGGLVLDVTLREGMLSSTWYMRDGQLASAGATPADAAAAVWDASGQFVAEVSVECSLVPLGLSVAAVPFPLMRWRCTFDRRGSTEVTCLEAGEPPFPTMAATVFDVDLFRKLLVEGCRIHVDHAKGADGQYALRCYVRFLFPCKSVAIILTNWFRDFMLRQFCDLDVMLAVADLFEALSKDSANISQHIRP